MNATQQAIWISEDTGGQIRTAPWLIFIFVTAAFFIISHDLNAPTQFRELMEAQSLEEYEGAAAMFEQRAWRQVGGLALGLFGLVLILGRTRQIGRNVGLLGVLVLIFLFWNVASLSWADDPGVTLRRLVLFSMLALGAVGVSNHLSPRDVLLFALIFPGVYLVIGAGNELISGELLRPWRGDYRFSGTIHPNNQAINCSLLLLAAYAHLRDPRSNRALFYAIMAVAVLFLLFTKSRTALASVMGALILHAAFSMDGGKRVALVSFGAMVFAGFLLFMETIFPPLQQGLRMGREDVGEETVGTLTGRTALWEQLWEFAVERPFLGYGYGGFWNEENTTAVMFEQDWPVSHGHNVYIDLMLEMGFIATILFAVVMIMAILRSYKYYHVSGNPGYAFLGLMLIFNALNGLLESAAIQRNELTFMLMLSLIYIAFHAPPGAGAARNVQQRDEAPGEAAAEPPRGPLHQPPPTGQRA